MSDLSSFLSTKNKQWSANLWDGFIEAVQARLAPLEEQLDIQKEVTDAIIARGLTVIEQELAPIVKQADQILNDSTASLNAKLERFEKKVTGGTVICASKTAASLANGATINLTLVPEDREFFAPTPFLAISRASTVANWAIGKVNSFNRQTGALSVTLEQVTGAGGPYNDWIITSLPGATLYQKHLLEQAILIDRSVQLMQEDVASMRDAVRAWNENVNTKHTQAVAAASSAEEDAAFVERAAQQVRSDAETVTANLAATKAHREAAGTSANTATQQASAAAQSNSASAENARVSGENKDASLSAKRAAETARDDAVAAKSETLSARDTAVTNRNESETFRNDAEGFRNEAEALAASLDPAQYLKKVDAGILSGFRNKLLNGDFRIAFRGAAFTIPANNGAYTADRWGVINTTNVPLSVEVVQDFNYGHALMFKFTSAPTTGEVTLLQKVEDVRTMPAGAATFTFDAYLENSMRVFIYGEQNFGTSGSALSVMEISNSVEPSSPDFKRKSVGFTVGSLDGKLANPFDSTFNIAVQFHPRNVGYFGVKRASLVAGDATAEKDPFSPRHRQQEVAMVQRYYYYLDRLEMFAQGGVSEPTFGRLGRAYMPVNMRTVPTVFIGFASEYNVKPTIFSGSTTGASFNGIVREAHNWGMIERITFDAEFPL
ncbi:hypothetical protein KQ944_18045 [Bacillus subtilis]|uniref:hypothetical protein n=1 Tax=Pseudochrobactrum asaccharolyticum TaxID=354351 RepID=UPI001F28D3A6|nr:hypothetical protein [Pseudochrobactrum asaccharolyticum]MCF7646899.1 hypothetical protein [Pseudochrobactrum asaccharolyticum]MCF7673541.1 hypothetical protein [Bacillus subtilis]